MMSFLERYRTSRDREIDLGVKRWSEDRRTCSVRSQNYLRLRDDAIAPDVQFARGAREAEAMIQTLTSRLHGPRRVFLRFLLGRVRLLGGLREQPEVPDHARLSLWATRSSRRSARSSPNADCSRRVDDVFFLTLPELRRAIAGEDLPHDRGGAPRGVSA